MLVPQQNEQICGVCCGTSIIPKIKEVTNYTFKERKKKKKKTKNVQLEYYTK